MTHPSEQRVGRIRNDGGWDRRYTPVWRQAEPFRVTWRDHIGNAWSIVWQAALLIVLFVGIAWTGVVFAEAMGL